MSDSVTPYPELVMLSEYKGIIGLQCYVVKKYQPGLACRLDRSKGRDTRILISDWAGVLCDLEQSPYKLLTTKLLGDSIPKLLQIVDALGIDSSEYYFSYDDNAFVLVDVRLSTDKFASPGMLKDVFATSLATQEIIDEGPLTLEKLDSIEAGRGCFAGDVIIKPAIYRNIQTKRGISPLYIEIAR